MYTQDRFTWWICPVYPGPLVHYEHDIPFIWNLFPQVFFASVQSGGSSQIYFMTLGQNSLFSWWPLDRRIQDQPAMPGYALPERLGNAWVWQWRIGLRCLDLPPPESAGDVWICCSRIVWPCPRLFSLVKQINTSTICNLFWIKSCLNHPKLLDLSSSLSLPHITHNSILDWWSLLSLCSVS